jgi:hypothetical protein
MKGVDTETAELLSISADSVAVSIPQVEKLDCEQCLHSIPSSSFKSSIGISKAKMEINGLFSAALSLFLAQMGQALIGPMFKQLEMAHVRPSLALNWRMQCMLLIFTPLVIMEWLSLSHEKRVVARQNVYPHLKFTKKQYILVLSCLFLC